MIFRFGVFDLDPAGRPVAIEPQVFNLLLYLVENRERVVTRDDLIAAVWDGRAVSDTTLSSRIFALRRVLGDTGEAQNVIRTVPRRGFRFVAEVTSDPEVAETHDTAAGNPDPVSDAAQASDKSQPPATPAIALPSAHGPVTLMPTLVVLPFAIASEGLDDYFCDGLTEDVISNLTHFSELRVIASASSFYFRARDIPLPEIAERLGADYVVDGSVRREGDRLRVAVQLIEAASGVSLWADRYDRKLEDIFAVQDAMTHMIVASLGVKMQDAALSRALRKSSSELDAYDHLLRARRYTATLHEEMHAEARDLLEQAIELDPNYAEAHALLANVYLAEHRFGANPLPNPIGRALKMALRATQLDPQSAYAHCWLGIVHFFQKDNGKFKAEMERALGLNPNDPEILAEAGHYYSFLGDFERGNDLSDRAKRLNPMHPGWFHFSSAVQNYHECRYEEVLVDVQRISMPNFYWTHLLNAAAFGQLERKEAAASLAMMKQVKTGISAETEMRKWNVAEADFAHIMEGLRKAGHDE